MEEILASIRRIISEDDGPATEAADEELVRFEADEETDDDVLELTERVAPREPETAPAPTVLAAAPPPAPEPAPPAPEPEPRGEVEMFPKSKPKAALMHDEDERLVSEHSAAAAASAFGRLTAAVAMPEHGRTLEDVTKELLKPMLKAWLDEHLPRIVEAKVAEEVERVSRGRVR